jgi:hypothetical protein
MALREDMTVEAPSSRTLVEASAPSISAISWAAIIAGAFAAAAISLILISLGAGFGLSTVSPWPRNGATITTFSLATAIWLVVVQWLSAAMGGYLTGRLRTHWTGLHTHEVAFRDTAHGFLAWALATVIGAFLLTAAVSQLVGDVGRAATQVATGTAQGVAQAGASNNGAFRNYEVDLLFRSSQTRSNDTVNSDARAEVGRILAQGMTGDALSSSDHDYLVNLVSARTGLSNEDARKRVDEVVADEKAAVGKIHEAADAARKATAMAAIFLAVSMLVGAFVASAAAALGGLRRDQHT